MISRRAATPVMSGSDTLFRNAWVLRHDGTTTTPQDVHVQDGVIVRVGRDLKVDASASIDCTGKTILPGLIDAHVHLAVAGPAAPAVTEAEQALRVAENCKALIRAGVTTARDVSGPSRVLLAQRAICASLLSAGPELLVSGEGITSIGGHGTEVTSARMVTEIAGPSAARGAVKRLWELGVDWVKVMLNGSTDEVDLTEAELMAIVDEARLCGLPVAAHASNRSAVALALRCGVRSIEHGNGLDGELAYDMARQDVALVATTHIYRAGAGCGTGRGEDPLLAFEPHVQAQVRGIMSARVSAHERAIPAALRAGVRLVLGTDAVAGPIGLAAEEIQALVAVGLSAPQALRAATVEGARLLGLHDRGEVAEGLRADLLLVRGRVDLHVEGLADPFLVMREGQLAAEGSDLR